MDESELVAHAKKMGIPSSGPMFDYYRPQIEEALANQQRIQRLREAQGYQENPASPAGDMLALVQATGAAAGRTNQDGTAPRAFEPSTTPALGPAFTAGPVAPTMAAPQQAQQQPTGLGAVQTSVPAPNVLPQMGLSDAPMPRVQAGGPTMQTGSAVASKPTQQPASFNYWQQYSPAQQTMPAMPTTAQTPRQRRGWVKPRTNGG